MFDEHKCDGCGADLDRHPPDIGFDPTLGTWDAYCSVCGNWLGTTEYEGSEP